MINDRVHSSLLVVFQKKIVQSVVTTIGSIVETQTPSHRLRYDGDIGFQTSITGRGVALVMGPPTVWVTARVVDTGPVARGGTVGNIVWKLGVDSGVDARKKLLGFCVSGKDGSSLPNSRERGCNLGHGGITVGCTFGGDVYVNHLWSAIALKYDCINLPVLAAALASSVTARLYNMGPPTFRRPISWPPHPVWAKAVPTVRVRNAAAVEGIISPA